MKQNTTTTKTLILAAALTLGAVASASAQSSNVSVPNPAEATVSSGLIGSRYTQVEANYIGLTGSGPNHADGFGVAFNQPLNANLDLTVNYDWARAKYAGLRATDQVLEAAATAYTTLAWGRPFVTVGAGWDWQKVDRFHGDSFLYRVGAGMEFLPAPKIAVTPFVNFVRATDFNTSEVELGVKATYRVNNDWSVTARAQYEAVRHDDDSAEYSLGVNYHF